MIAKSIRKLMIEFPERLRDVLLTDQQLSAFKTISHYCRADPIRACQIMSDKSPQHKSGILFELWKRGYIEKRQVTAESGGYEFEYWPVDGLESTEEE